MGCTSSAPQLSTGATDDQSGGMKAVEAATNVDTIKKSDVTQVLPECDSDPELEPGSRPMAATHSHTLDNSPIEDNSIRNSNDKSIDDKLSTLEEMQEQVELSVTDIQGDSVQDETTDKTSGVVDNHHAVTVHETEHGPNEHGIDHIMRNTDLSSAVVSESVVAVDSQEDAIKDTVEQEATTEQETSEHETAEEQTTEEKTIEKETAQQETTEKTHMSEQETAELKEMDEEEEMPSPSQSASSRMTRWEALADIAAELPPSLAVDPLTGQIYTTK